MADLHSSTHGSNRQLSTLAISLLLVVTAGCTDNGEQPPVTETPTTTQPASTVPVSTSEPAATTTPQSPTLEQLALWPNASEVFDSARAVAEDFVVQVLGVPPELGDFMAGDSRSGEIEVFSPGDPPSGRGLLLLRQLGPANGWFVIGTINDNALITTPVAGQSVQPGPLIVQGLAEGFEATVIVEAFIAGRAEPVLDRKVTYAGNLGVVGPFEVTLDLSAAQPGDIVLILVRGGVGLETDPGEFGAIAVVISS